MKDSIILQVDESTKGLMEQVQSGISSSIENSISDVKSDIEDTRDNTDRLLSKLRNFDGLGSSIEQLQSVAKETQKFADMASPLQQGVHDIQQKSNDNSILMQKIKERIEVLSQHVQDDRKCSEETKATINKFSGKIIDDLSSQSQQIVESVTVSTNGQIAQSEGNIKKLIEKSLQMVEEMQMQSEMHADEHKKELDSVKFLVNDLKDSYIKNEEMHCQYETKLTEEIATLTSSVEKLQTTLDIVVNLVTPFWKKWNK